MLRAMGLGMAMALALATMPALAEEPIQGKWKTASGETAEIVPCGKAFCITIKTGPHAGKSIGRLAGTDESYTGEITDPASGKTYSGSGAISANTLKLKGCVMSVLCKSQTWTRL